MFRLFLDCLSREHEIDKMYIYIYIFVDFATIINHTHNFWVRDLQGIFKTIFESSDLLVHLTS